MRNGLPPPCPLCSFCRLVSYTDRPHHGAVVGGGRGYAQNKPTGWSHTERSGLKKAHREQLSELRREEGKGGKAEKSPPGATHSRVQSYRRHIYHSERGGGADRAESDSAAPLLKVIHVVMYGYGARCTLTKMFTAV